MISFHAWQMCRWASSRRARLIVHTVTVMGLLSLLLPTMTGPPTAHAASFVNSTSITIPATGTSGPASPYPSTINVSGLTGVVTKVKVTLTGFTHASPDDVDILLVGPTGANAIIMSDAGGPSPGVTNLTITLDDAAASALPDGSGLASGTYRPTNYSGFGSGSDSFPAPSGGSAPPFFGGSVLSAFNGTDPNGAWKVYVVDDQGSDTGSITGGWSLEVFAARLFISELRLQGVGGAADEFVEI
jgi:subtilisin-like proprotein convertase family protein